MTSGARSTESGTNDENKPNYWKFTNNDHLTYHLCAQNLPNSYHGDPERKYIFEDDKFIYDVVFPVREEYLQVDRNLHQKIGKTVLVIEISLSALLPEIAVSCTELRIAQDQPCWKEDNVGFP